MKNLIEYMLLFIVLLLFCPNNYLTIIYIVVNLVLVGLTIALYKIKNKEKDSLKKQIDFSYFVTIIGIILINVMMKNGMLNLLLGGIFTLCYIGQFVYSLIKKDYAFKKSFLSDSLIFDIYSLGYLLFLTIELQQYL